MRRIPHGCLGTGQKVPYILWVFRDKLGRFQTSFALFPATTGKPVFFAARVDKIRWQFENLMQHLALTSGSKCWLAESVYV